MLNILFIQIDKSQHAIFFTSSSLIGINGHFKEKFQVQGTQKEILQPRRGNVMPPCRPQALRFYIHLTASASLLGAEGSTESATKCSWKKSLGLEEAFHRRVWNARFQTEKHDEDKFLWRGWLLLRNPALKSNTSGFQRWHFLFSIYLL